MLNNDTLVVDADSHWYGAARPLHQAWLPPSTRTGCRGWRRSTACRRGCSTATSLGQASARRRHRPRRQQGERRPRRSTSGRSTTSTSAPTTRRPGSRCSTSAASTRRSSSRAPSASAARTSAWSTTRPSAGWSIEIYNDQMAEIQAESGNRLLPHAAHAGVGRRHVRRRGQAGRRARCAGRQHDVRPAGPRRARPRQPGVGPVLGDLHRARSCRCTSTSAPASPR